jgi:cyclopropane-fatty-acyl-phospholipid synthase
MPVVERAGMWATDIEILRLHYAYTLERWYARVQRAQRDIEALYDARFFRMWSYYLASAITAFRHGGHCNFQVQLAPRRDTVPITRRYMDRVEDRYRSQSAGLAEAAE